MAPMSADGQQQFRTETGIDIQTDIDRVILALVSVGDQKVRMPDSALVLARGRFDQVKIEALMREHGAHAEDYRGVRVVDGEAPEGSGSVSVAFLEPGLLGVGSTALVRRAVELKSGGPAISTNDEMMGLIRDLGPGNAWAAGRFDVLASRANIPPDLTGQIPPVHMFSASAQIDSGIRGMLRADSNDEAAANSLRDVIRGFVALARMQTSSRPEVSSVLQSVQLGGAGKTVSLSFDVPASALDALASLPAQLGASRPRRRP